MPSSSARSLLLRSSALLRRQSSLPCRPRPCPSFAYPVIRCPPPPSLLSPAVLSTAIAGPIGIVRRTLARSSVPSGACETPEDKARTFVISLGNDAAIADGVVSALRDSGLSGESLLATVRSMAGRWEVGEDEGLEALVASVKQNLARTEGREFVRIHCVPPNAWDSGEEEAAEEEEEAEDKRKAMMARAFPVEALEGTSLTDVAKFGEGEGASTLGEYIECACSGIMACSTCHVVVDPQWYDRVGPPTEAEQDMIDLAYGPRETSRLGCQIVLTKELDGLVVKIPGGANNLMDFVPFDG